MGAGKTTLGTEAARRIGRPFVDLDDEIRARTGATIVELFARGEPEFRRIEEDIACELLQQAQPHAVALGGGAVLSERTRAALRVHATTVLVAVDVDEAWRRSQNTDRPLAQSAEQFAALYEERRPLYESIADAHARDVDDVVL